MEMPKLYIMVGLSGSGKSTISKKIAKENDCVIVSSDGIRKEICEGGIADQSKNDEVFKIFNQRIKSHLLSGKNVIADATNINIKSRRSVIENVKKILCFKIAYIVPKSIEDCIHDNHQREYIIPDFVIKKQLYKFQIPFKEEGFNEIIVHRFENNYANYAFVPNCREKMRGFDQKNPHHTMDLDEHCKFTYEKFKRMGDYIYTEYPFSARLHDIGKLFTQTFGDNGIAHYYNHENVGCYYLLSNFDNLKRYINYSDEELLNILFLVNYHMMPMSWDSDKASQKWLRRFGEYKYKLLLDFNKCDKAR